MSVSSKHMSAHCTSHLGPTRTTLWNAISAIIRTLLILTRTRLRIPLRRHIARNETATVLIIPLRRHIVRNEILITSPPGDSILPYQMGTSHHCWEDVLARSLTPQPNWTHRKTIPQYPIKQQQKDKRILRTHSLRICIPLLFWSSYNTDKNQCLRFYNPIHLRLNYNWRNDSWSFS